MKIACGSTLLKLIQVLAITFYMSVTFAAKDIERFNLWIDQLEKSTAGTKNGEAAVKKLKENPTSRIAAFNLQALGKLYETINPDFKIVKVEFKKIEDGLGAIDKWDKLENDKQKEKATKDFAGLLEKEGWTKKDKSARINKIRKQINDLTDKLKNSDKQLVDQLKEHLQKIDATSFNFEVLEAGNGLHEFRRQIRWFMIESQVLNGLMTFKQGDSCPIEQYEHFLSEPIAESKYSSLATNSDLKKTCEISRCLFVAMADAVENLGQLKDKAEKAIGNTKSDKTPQDLVGPAQEISDLIHSTRLLKRLQDEIKECN